MATERNLLQRIERAGPLTWLLAAATVWAVLVWVAALAGMGGELRPTPVLAAEPLPKPTPVQPARIGPLAQYSEAAARPLFTADRRPRNFMATGPEGDAGAAQPQSLEFILTGVLISPQVQLAIVQPTGGGESQRVRVGQSPEGASGWQLLSLEPRRAVFQGGGGQVTLDLRTFGDTAAPPPGAPRTADSANAAVAAARDAAAASAAASAASAASAAANGGAPPQTDQARIEAIRRRIEARRAQQRAAGQSSGAPTPQMP